MNKTLPILTAAALAVCGVRAVEVDGVAATVGSATILRSDVASEMLRRGIDDPSRFGEVRNRLIERELILKAAAASKLTMQDWIVEDRIRTIVEDAFGGDRNRLVETLAKEKTPYSEWRKRIKDDMVVNAMRWSVVDRNVRASPAAMRDEYDAHPERYREGGRVTVSVILLKPEDAALRETVDEELKKEDFAEVAKRRSADSRARDGGLWKDVRPEEVFKPEVCEEISRTPPGTISKWVDLDGWSFLLRKDAESGDAQRSFAEAYPDVEAAVRAAEGRRLYDAWMERLKSETYIHVY